MNNKLPIFFDKLIMEYRWIYKQPKFMGLFPERAADDSYNTDDTDCPKPQAKKSKKALTRGNQPGRCNRAKKDCQKSLVSGKGVKTSWELAAAYMSAVTKSTKNLTTKMEYNQGWDIFQCVLQPRWQSPHRQ